MKRDPFDDSSFNSGRFQIELEPIFFDLALTLAFKKISRFSFITTFLNRFCISRGTVGLICPSQKVQMYILEVNVTPTGASKLL